MPQPCQTFRPKEDCILPKIKDKTGGGGGSRTRVRKCSPLVSTCLVPGLKVRIWHAAGTERTRCYSVKISPAYVQTPSTSQPVESTLRSGLTGEDRGNGSGLLSRYSVVIIVGDYNLVSISFTSRRKLGMQRRAYTSPSKPFRPQIVKDHKASYITQAPIKNALQQSSRSADARRFTANYF